MIEETRRDSRRACDQRQSTVSSSAHRRLDGRRTSFASLDVIHGRLRVAPLPPRTPTCARSDAKISTLFYPDSRLVDVRRCALHENARACVALTRTAVPAYSKPGYRYETQNALTDRAALAAADANAHKSASPADLHKLRERLFLVPRVIVRLRLHTHIESSAFRKRRSPRVADTTSYASITTRQIAENGVL